MCRKPVLSCPTCRRSAAPVPAAARPRRIAPCAASIRLASMDRRRPATATPISAVASISKLSAPDQRQYPLRQVGRRNLVAFLGEVNAVPLIHARWHHRILKHDHLDAARMQLALDGGEIVGALFFRA